MGAAAMQLLFFHSDIANVCAIELKLFRRLENRSVMVPEQDEFPVATMFIYQPLAVTYSPVAATTPAH